MRNQDVALLLYELADLQDILGIEWKPVAFRKAARNIEAQKDDVTDVYNKGGVEALQEIPGVGEAIAKKIVEIIQKGMFDELERTRKRLPDSIVDLMKVRGVGPKTVKVLYNKLDITSIDDLEKAAKDGRIRRLPGFGEKSEQDIIEALSLLHKGQERTPLGMALARAREIQTTLERIKGVSNVMIAGSVRRRRETCKDIDILAVATDTRSIMEAFTTMDAVRKVTGKGTTKSSVILEDGMAADLRVVKPESVGAALQYFSGSKEHNVRLRQLALKKGLTLNEYGLYTRKGDRYVCGKTEKEIYERIGVPFVPPELRENAGEFDIKKVPALVKYDALKGDLHMHTRWSDGMGSPQDMIEAARRLGYEYIAITDHSQSQYQANGMSKRRLLDYVKEIRALGKGDIRVFVGSEVDIKPDGSLDYDDRLLDELDIVVAAVHSAFKQDQKTMTKRILKALSNEHVTILGHPTGRLINQRPPIEFDADAVFDAAIDNGVALEVNGNPMRLDLSDTLCRRAKEAGCRLVIDTDAHHPDHLSFAELGIATARRGWLAPTDIINTLPLKRFEKALRG